MTRREKIHALKRRLTFLRQRIIDNAPKRLTFDEAEAGALQWALNALRGITDVETRDVPESGDGDCGPQAERAAGE